MICKFRSILLFQLILTLIWVGQFLIIATAVRCGFPGWNIMKLWLFLCPTSMASHFPGLDLHSRHHQQPGNAYVTCGLLGSPKPQALDIILMTTVRAVALLYSYHRLRSLHLSIEIIPILVGQFTVFSSFVFTSSVVNVMQNTLSDLK